LIAGRKKSEAALAEKKLTEKALLEENKRLKKPLS